MNNFIQKQKENVQEFFRDYEIELSTWDWIKAGLGVLLLIGALYFYNNLDGAESVGSNLFSFFAFVLCGLTFVFMFLPKTITLVAELVSRAAYRPGSQVDTKENDFSAAKAMVSQGRYQQAISELQGILNNDPTNWKAQHEIAKVQDHHMEQPGQAAQSYEQCLQMMNIQQDGEVDSTIIYFVLNRLVDLKQKQMGDIDGALNTLQQHLHLIPEGSPRYEELQSKLEKLKKMA